MLPGAVLLMAGGCDGADSGPAPPVPPHFMVHDELPFGDRALHRVTRAILRASDLLEPDWGRLDSQIYTIATTDRAAVVARLPSLMPPGWKPLSMPPLERLPGEKDATLHAFTKGRRLYAVLLVETPEAGNSMAAIILRNENGN